MSPRPGFVLEVDKSTPATLIWHGEGFRLERLPVGTGDLRARARPPLADPDEAIRHALDNPLGDSQPLRTLLFPGMRLTIAFDDISLPLPPMQRPDVRQRVMEAVLDQAADAGVDDVVLIAALALHRRMTEPELRHALGDRIYDAFAPQRSAATNTMPRTRRTSSTWAHRPRRGRGDQQPGRRERPAHLREHQPGGHGRRAQCVATGLASYKSITPPPQPRARCGTAASFMDLHHSELHCSNWRMGRLIADAGVKVFQIETTLNTDTFPEGFAVPAEARVGVDGSRTAPASWPPPPRSTGPPAGISRKIFHSVQAPTG